MKKQTYLLLSAAIGLASSARADLIGSYDFENLIDNISPTDDVVVNGGTGGSVYDLLLPDFSQHSGAGNALTTGVAGPGSLGGNVLSPGTDGGYGVIDAGGDDISDTAFDGATGLTITGWYRGSAGNPVLANGRIIDSTIAGNASGFFLRAESTMAARLRVGDGSTGANVDTPAGFFVSDDTWRFFAVTWDGTDGAVNFYSGTDTVTASLAHSGNNGLSAIGNFGAGATFPNLTIGVQGSNPSGAQFGAFLDNIALYNEALGLTDIQGIQLAAVPEPGTYALLFGLAGLGLVLWRRRGAARR
jgi:hypothetical protein